MRTKLKIGNNIYNVIHEFPVLYSGWECDYEAWIIDYEGKPRLVTTDHGGFDFDETDLLTDKIEEYKRAIAETQRALETLGAMP